MFAEHERELIAEIRRARLAGNSHETLEEKQPMHHIKSVTQTPSLAQFDFGGGSTIDPLQQLILILLGAFYSDHPDAPAIIGDLQKYFRKLP